MSESYDPPLREDEVESLDRLTSLEDPPPEEIVQHIRELFGSLRVIPREVLAGSQRLHRGEFIMLGLAVRTHDLTLGAIDGVSLHNRHVVSACLRGLAETFSAIAWANDEPDRLLSFLDPDSTPGLKKMRDAAYERLDGLKERYDWLSQSVHPRPLSLLAAFQLSAPPEEGLARYTFPSPAMKPDEVRESSRIAAELGEYTTRELVAFVQQNPDVLRAGSPMADLEDTIGRN